MKYRTGLCVVAAALVVACGANSDDASPNATGGGTDGGSLAATGGGGGATAVGGGGQGGGGLVAGMTTTAIGYHTQGSQKGQVLIHSFEDGSTITGTVDGGQWCVNGNVVACRTNPATGNCSDDPMVGVSWALNQDALPDGGLGEFNAADLHEFTKIAVGLSGADGLNLRLQLDVGDPNGTMTFYCGPLPGTGTSSDGMLLSDLAESCWSAGGAAFDPATIQPVGVSIVVRDPPPPPAQGQSFDFCITQLEFLP